MIASAVSSPTVKSSAASDHQSTSTPPLSPTTNSSTSDESPPPLMPRHWTGTPTQATKTRQLPIPPSYWESSNAQSLFQPRAGELVITCLLCRIVLLQKVIDNWPTHMFEVIAGGEDTYITMSDPQKNRISHHCLYLCRAY